MRIVPYREVENEVRQAYPCERLLANAAMGGLGAVVQAPEAGDQGIGFGSGRRERCPGERHTILDEEVERQRFLHGQIEAVIILHSLKQHIAQIVTASDAPAATSPSGEPAVLVSFHWSLLLLQSFVVINFTAVVKILKKFDKKLGTLIGRTLRASYIGALTELPLPVSSPGWAR